MWHNLCTHTTPLYQWVVSQIHMCDITPAVAAVVAVGVSCHQSHLFRRYAWHDSLVQSSRLCARTVSYMNESCPIYECIMSHIWLRDMTHWCNGVVYVHELCHIWTSHVLYMSASCHTCKYVTWLTGMMASSVCTNYVPYKWVMSHMNESCPIYECVMSQIWIRDVTHGYDGVVCVHELCPIWMSHVPCERDMSYIWVRHFTHMNVWRDSRVRWRRLCARTMSHMNESCPIWMSRVPYEW